MKCTNERLTCRLAVNLRVLSLTLLLLVACTVRAQIAGTGTIQGSITDATGALIPNAMVTLTEASTQVKRTIQSDSSGVYVFPNINVGTYSVSVTAPGFETYTRTGTSLKSAAASRSM